MQPDQENTSVNSTEESAPQPLNIDALISQTIATPQIAPQPAKPGTKISALWVSVFVAILLAVAALVVFRMTGDTNRPAQPQAQNNGVVQPDSAKLDACINAAHIDKNDWTQAQKASIDCRNQLTK